jgi:hypothetical protein
MTYESSADYFFFSSGFGGASFGWASGLSFSVGFAAP